MRRFWGATGALATLVALALVATLATSVGAALWHYNAAFAATLAAGLAAGPLLARRRVATMAMATSGIVATASGFAMLYTKDFPAKDWITWWHSVTSAAFVLAFLVHWVHNRTRLADFTSRLTAREPAWGGTIGLLWLLVGAAFAWTWLTPAQASFTRENYLALASWAVLGGVVLAYAPWLAYRLPTLRARLRATAHRNHVRALVDTSLFLSNAGALLTGFALVYFAEPLRAGTLKYVSKWWHTATSVALLALLALHVGFNARVLRAHARRLEEDLGGAPSR